MTPETYQWLSETLLRESGLVTVEGKAYLFQARLTPLLAPAGVKDIDGLVGVLVSPGEGTFDLPGGVCAGTELGLADPSLLTAVTADANGDVLLTPTAPAGACDLFLQAVDVTACSAGNTARIP